MFLPAGIVQQQRQHGGSPPPSPYWSHSWTSISSTTIVTQRLGYRFTVGVSDLTVNKLSYYAREAEDELVIIHRVSDGAVIASATITAVIDTWVDESISEIVLSAGAVYTISFRAGGASRSVYRNPSGLSYVAGITHNAYVFGTDDNLPTSTTGNAYVSARFGYA